MSARRPRLAFVSPVFLFPTDTGGKIRTTNVLRGMKGGKFEVTLIAPATPEQLGSCATEIESVCDHFVAWQPSPTRPRWRRAIDVLGSLPVSVAADCSRDGRQVVRRTLASGGFDLTVFDFVHTTVLRPARVEEPTVCFTHNVEAEIFQRHAEQAGNMAMRKLWKSQSRKMTRFESDSLRRFTRIVAVSERDGMRFRDRYGLTEISVIPTGVDLSHFTWSEPPEVSAQSPPAVVFTGSMDWAANVDGIGFFLESVWPAVVQRIPAARFIVVGRSPPPALVQAGRSVANVHFTGFVDDVRPHVRAAHVFVIPLRVGGGTRIKAFEAMAMGCPVVSTAIGIEGLDVKDGVHYLCRDSASDQAAAIVDLLGHPEKRRRLALQARECVEARFGHVEVAQVFERACTQAMESPRVAKRTTDAGGNIANGSRGAVASKQ